MQMFEHFPLIILFYILTVLVLQFLYFIIACDIGS